jgi:hypothetical protein
MAWAQSRGVRHLINDAGKPTQNACIESFNGKFRDECLSLDWFRSRADAKVVIESWRRHYNFHLPNATVFHRAHVSRLGLDENNVVRSYTYGLNITSTQ